MTLGKCQGYSLSQSLQLLFNELNNAGFLDNENKFIINYQYLSEWIISHPDEFPTYYGLSFIDRAGVLGQIKNTLAEHAFFSDFNNLVLEFFISILELPGDANQDGIINVIDVIALINIILNI